MHQQLPVSKAACISPQWTATYTTSRSAPTTTTAAARNCQPGKVYTVCDCRGAKCNGAPAVGGQVALVAGLLLLQVVLRLL